MDEFQERYLEHQERKRESLENFKGNEKTTYTNEEKETLLKILSNRRSQRIFNDEMVLPKDIKIIEDAIRITPSSCNRQTIYIQRVDPRMAERFLVGGKGWIGKANKVLFLFASKEAYKSPNEKAFMPFLDVGFVGQNIYLMCEVLGIGCCFVNPNTREENKEAFIKLFGDDYFGGAVALGHYDKKAKKPPLRDISKILRK